MEDNQDNDEMSNPLYFDKQFIPINAFIHKWEDVDPIDQYDKSTDPGICKIDYSDDFEFTMKYFRAILQSNEISRRALELTQEVIKVNYGCYTAWYYRRKLLDQIGTPEDWKWEIYFLNTIGVELEKNYQIWHHRRCIVQSLNDPSAEKQFLDTIFESDDKNYHAWSYRIWLIQHFNLFDGEEEYIDEMIKNNPLNNSAWSYRRFVISHTKDWCKDTISKEIAYAFSMILEFKMDNEAAWVYLRGYFATSKDEEQRSLTTNAKRMLITEFQEVFENLEKITKDMKEGDKGQRFVHTVLLDWNNATGDKEKCKEICEMMGSKWDRIRENYWKYRKEQYCGFFIIIFKK